MHICCRLHRYLSEQYDHPSMDYQISLMVSSKLHWVWIATVCVRMRTDLSYSGTIGWNNFPVPTLTDKNKADLTRCAENILLAREAHFPATIADLYDPTTCPPTCGRRTNAMMKCWNASTSAAASETTPNGWKSCSSFIPRWLNKIRRSKRLKNG